MTLIFVSYRPDEDGGYAEALLADLCDAVRLLGGGEPLLRVFLSTDESLIGDDWSAGARDALTDCTVFLAICSQRYFLTERCGREWWTFQDRLAQHDTITGRRPRALVPIAWGDSGLHGDLPADRFASDIARHDDVRALVRLRSNRARYRELIDDLARHIVEVSHNDPVRPTAALLPYRVTPNAFRVFGRRHSHPAVIGPGSSPPAVRFVLAAGRRDEMAPVREDLAYYGAHRTDWQPYRPQRSDTIAVQAQTVAADHLFHSDVVDNIEDIVEVLERADGDDELVVMLVDAWVVRLAAHRKALRAAARHRYPAVAMVVPVSVTDAETTSAREQLTATLSRLLAARSARSGPMLRVGPESAEEFEQEVGSILETARNRTFRSADVRRVAPGAPAGSRPMLDAP